MTTASCSRPPAVAARTKATPRVRFVIGIVAGVILLGWMALKIRPAPFAPITASPEVVETVPLPAGLPVPVQRFYRQRYGDHVPIIRSAVITGRGTMRVAPLFNLTFPARFRFTHEAGRNYRHYIEVTLFGLPALKVNEYFVDGKERQVLPWAVMTDNPKLDQGGNLGMWAEILRWLPAALLTDPKVRWEPFDDDSAMLVVPFGDEEERFVVRFSEVSGEIAYWEVMRYADGAGEKTLWVNGTWFEDGRPWFVIQEEQVTLNIDVDTSVTAKGP
jgi:hypothetical protein